MSTTEQILWGYALFFVACLILPRLTHSRGVTYFREKIAPYWLLWFFGISFVIAVGPALWLSPPAWAAILAVRPAKRIP